MSIAEHLEKLNYFYAIADLGSFKRASQSLRITQPSLTKSIKILEDACGHALFTRLPRGVSLTPAGKRVYEFCSLLRGQVVDLEKRLNAPSDELSGRIRVGTYDSIGIYFWPDFLKGFLKKFPNVDIDLTTGRSHEIYDQLKNNKIDLALIIDPVGSASIETKLLRKDRYKFFAAAKSFRQLYSTEDEVPLIIMPDAKSQNGTLEQELPLKLLQNRRIYRMSSLESVKELTLKGIGIGLLPELVAKESVESKVLTEYRFGDRLKNHLGSHFLGLAYCINAYCNELIGILVSEICSDFEEPSLGLPVRDS